MTKPCKTCTKTFIDEGVERKRDYPLERECVECLKVENDRLKVEIYLDWHMNHCMDDCPPFTGYDIGCPTGYTPNDDCEECWREALDENIGD